MTIQIPDPGTGVPADKTGDNPWLAMTKVAANFSNQTHAASRLLGTETGQVPLSQDTFKAAHQATIDAKTLGYTSCNQLPVGSLFTLFKGDGFTETPPLLLAYDGWYIATIGGHNAALKIQIAYGLYDPTIASRAYVSGEWKSWSISSQNPLNYSTTTAAGANTVVDTTGKLMRSTSSERYKDILAPLELDDERYAAAMSLKPIVYRSTADADNPLHHFYSFSAEELGAYDPAFTLWRTTEMVTDADGNTTEQPLAERQAEGININALLAMSHAIAIKQDKLIKKLETRIAALEPKTEA